MGLAVFVAPAIGACAARTPSRPIPDNAIRRPEPRYVGRFDFSDAAGPRFAWSGSTIEVRFTGTRLAMRLAVPKREGEGADPASAPAYTVFVDRDERATKTFSVSPATETYLLADGLSPRTEHVAIVVRESEVFAGVHQVLGFDVGTGGELLDARPSPSRASRQAIEFIGDSITCGYGVAGENADCGFSFATERATLAYPALVGRALDADVVSVCASGHGIYRNYDAGGALMPAIYDHALPDLGRVAGAVASPSLSAASASLSPPPSASSLAPFAVVVNLGTNDFLADHDHDKIPDRIDLRAFEDAYVAFLVELRSARPMATILVTTSPMLPPPLAPTAKASLAAIVDRRRADGDTRVELLPLSFQEDRVGCDRHPNANMHRILAAEIEAAVRRASLAQ